MHIKKFTKDYTRRHFLETAGKLGATVGVLTPLWDLICKTGDSYAAYPDEAWDIETHSGGQVKVGGELNAGNVDSVKDLLEPIAYHQIKNDGRIVDIVEPVTDVGKLMPKSFFEATLRNQGQAQFDAKGNVVTKDGRPWIGGNPFPQPENAQQALVSKTMSWGRYDTFMTPGIEVDLNRNGDQQYEYNLIWVEVQAVARTKLEPTPYMPGFEDKLRFNTVLFTYPGDMAGSSLLNVWPYDQTQFPDFNGYLPAFKRVRRFPTNQRFEPVAPGSTFYISDAWTTGDPYLTWGNFKILERKTALGNVTHHNWHPDQDNWRKPRVGGPKGNKYFRTAMCVVPEVVVLELEPTGYPRSPYSKKIAYLDARTFDFLGHIVYDRKGELWKQWEIGAGQYAKPDGPEHILDGNPLWSWMHVHSYDSQADYMTLLEPPRQIAGGYQFRANDPNLYENFCTIEAIRRLGT